MEICQATAGVTETEKFEQLHYRMTCTQQVFYYFFLLHVPLQCATLHAYDQLC